MNKPISDLQERLRALEPQHSFIVQAPAGSGKTELLTQRFLVLLARAKTPEEIVAITFTRKAAGEMRARILEAIAFASEIKIAPEEPHTKLRWELAKAVINQDQICGWNLLHNPNRLHIQTIDALCARITRHMPILAKFGAQPNITDDAKELYQFAAREILNGLETNTLWSKQLTNLLLHLDNDHSKVEALLCDMLAKRDQWLPYIFNSHKDCNLRQLLENGLQTVITETLIKLDNNITSSALNELTECLEFSIRQLQQQKFDSTRDYLNHLTANIKDCLNHANLKKYVWLACADMLLTDKHEWRKVVNIKNGFPPQHKLMKQRMEALLTQLSSNEILRKTLIDLRKLPAAQYSDSQWQILTALLELLPILVAQLQIVFQIHHTVDYIEIAQSALAALGDPQNPTDLALALDYQVKHLLVDEFQDTSLPQLRLLEQLTAGWQANDGRTLFLVGDPMQSIYRFRKAEVAIFLQSRQQGIGSIPLTPLTLTVNFRSSRNIVNWVNTTFKTLLPEQEDISNGAVSFSPSEAHHATHSASAIYYHWLLDADTKHEAETVANIAKQALAEKPNSHIAILVRARSHLREILNAFKLNNIPYRAVEIETLSEKPIIRDLLALTRALLHPADRIAWLAILRAPWCGLTLQDLHGLFSFTDHSTQLERTIIENDLAETTLFEENLSNSTSIWAQLLNVDQKNISQDGKQRLKKIVPILEHCIKQRERLPLATWVESTWVALNGPACLNDMQAINEAKAFFDLLSQLPLNENAKDYIYIAEQLNKLYATSTINQAKGIEVMTMHKAKGLEFDIVILPGLHRMLTADDPELLLCLERANFKGKSDLLFAPIKSSQIEEDIIYNYLRHEEKKKADYETTRLLYVAVTRAKTALHLTGILKSDEKTLFKPPAQNSLLGQIWPAVRNDATNHIVRHERSILPTTQTPAPMVLKRLSLQSFLSLPTHLPLASASNNSAPFEWKFEPLKHIGTIVHLILRKIAQDGLDKWNLQTIKQQKPYIKNVLLQLGVIPTQLKNYIHTVEQALVRTLKCQRGRWILNNSHLDAKAEYALTAFINNEVKQLVIDRTFIDENNIRWIVDYKTTNYEGDDLESFLENELNNHREQLENYAEAMRLLDNRKIRLGLYFPLLNAWKEWEYLTEVNN